MNVKGRKIPGLVGEERQGDGEELVSPVRDRILTTVKSSTHIRLNFRFLNENLPNDYQFAKLAPSTTTSGSVADRLSR